MSRTSLRTAATALIAVGLAVVAPPAADARRAFPQSDLVETLERAGGFTTLLALLDETELTETVAGGGPFTILAPTDDAFEKLPQETVDFLLANPDVLTDVLLYHVVEGSRSIRSLLRSNTAETLLREPVLVTLQHREIFVNQSRVVRRDIRAENGVVHAIDTVLTPPEEPVEISSIIDVLRLDGRFGTLLSVLEATGLDAALAGPGPLTLFAPTDDAFDALATLHAAGEKFDVVVVDPPAFIKRRRDFPKGQAAYRKLNQLAMQVMSSDAILVSCSCSHHLATEDLFGAIQQASRHLNRFAQIIEIGGQAPDHPIHGAIPETRYLKSIVSRIVHD